jgi:hypothetical protein
MKFKYIGESDWLQDKTFTYLSSYYNVRSSTFYIVVIEDDTGRIVEFERYSLQKICKLEEAMK